MSKIASVMSFCSNDLRFLEKCITSLEPFSAQILIPICDHFYDGTSEDLSLLQKIYQKYPRVDFIEFAYSEKELYATPAPLVPHSPGFVQHWHNTARFIGSLFLDPEIEWVLFVDVDEIFEGNLLQVPFTDYAALRFATYWYFGSADNCATVYPDGPLLLRRNLLSTDLLMNSDERMGMFFQIEGRKQREFCFQDKPLVHHYSWVRTKEEIQKKTTTWGHHWERDWQTLFQKYPEQDVVRKYEYRKVVPFWDPLQVSFDFTQKDKSLSHVRKVTPKEIARLEIQAILKGGF